MTQALDERPAPGFASPTRFLRWGLRTNPFCQLEHAALARLLPTPAWARAALATPWHGLVITGPSGLGKTSTAHALMRALTERGDPFDYHRLSGANPPWPALPDDRARLQLIDSVQRLRWWRLPALRARLAHGVRHVLIGQRDVSRWARLGARFTIHHLTPPPPDAAELHVAFTHHLSRARLPNHPTPPPTLSDEAAAALLSLSHGNRMRLRELLYLTLEALSEHPPDARPTRVDAALIAEASRRLARLARHDLTVHDHSEASDDLAL